MGSPLTWGGLLPQALRRIPKFPGVQMGEDIGAAAIPYLPSPGDIPGMLGSTIRTFNYYPENLNEEAKSAVSRFLAPTQPATESRTPPNSTSNLGPTRAGFEPAMDRFQQEVFHTPSGPVSKAQAAAAPEAGYKAVRLPSGRVVFTNQSLEGETVDAYKAARNVGQQDQAAAKALSTGGSPVSDVMGAAVRRAAMFQSRGEEAPRGTVSSALAVTPEMQQAATQQALLGAAALGQAQTAAVTSMKSPEEQAILSNPKVLGIMQFMGMLNKSGADRVRELSTPGSPSYIADPKLRDAAVQQVQADVQEKLGALAKSSAI